MDWYLEVRFSSKKVGSARVENVLICLAFLFKIDVVKLLWYGKGKFNQGQLYYSGLKLLF